jgi:hypothetical protein
MTVEDLWQEFGSPKPPATIWQNPFDYDSKHLHSLCKCQAEGRSPDQGDMSAYALDLTYQEIQPDLLVFLLPICLRAWSMYLLGQGAVYEGSIEELWGALNRKPGALGLLSEKQRNAVERYFREGILMAIDAGHRLRSASSNAACYRWLYDIGSFASVFPRLSQLWSSWWDLNSEGRAIGALQYMSCLMYEAAANPVFAPWTPLEGGGPPGLWADSMSYNKQYWDSENIIFLQGVLVPSQLFSMIDRCQERLTNPEDQRIALQMKQDFERQRLLLEKRIEQLPVILSADHYLQGRDWPI